MSNHWGLPIIGSFWPDPKPPTCEFMAEILVDELWRPRNPLRVPSRAPDRSGILPASSGDVEARGNFAYPLWMVERQELSRITSFLPVSFLLPTTSEPHCFKLMLGYVNNMTRAEWAWHSGRRNRSGERGGKLESSALYNSPVLGLMESSPSLSIMVFCLLFRGLYP